MASSCRLYMAIGTPPGSFEHPLAVVLGITVPQSLLLRDSCGANLDCALAHVSPRRIPRSNAKSVEFQGLQFGKNIGREALATAPLVD